MPPDLEKFIGHLFFSRCPISPLFDPDDHRYLRLQQLNRDEAIIVVGTAYSERFQEELFLTLSRSGVGYMRPSWLLT